MEPVVTFSEYVQNHPILVGLFVALIFMLLYSEYQRFTRRFNEVSPLEAVSLINNQKAVVIDVRPESEFKSGHITNAINIPLQDFSSHKKKLEKHKGKPIIVYCKSGMTSTQACKELEKSEFDTVHNLRGGVNAWIQEQLFLVK